MMMFRSLVVLSTILLSAWSFQPENVDGSRKLAYAALQQQSSYASTTRAAQSCSNPAVRKEWSELSANDRRQWIAAVYCLMDKPSISGNLAPGARSRYDDFLGTHINQTMVAHFTGKFLFWHRYLVSTFETALRNECNYKGYQPYANWGKYAQDPIGSPVFDGSGTSIGSNGVFSPRTSTKVVPFWAPPNAPHIELPTNDLGGGCIMTGPFSDRTVNLGPVNITVGIGPGPVNTTADLPPNPRQDGLGYNPRCIKREISSYITTRTVTDKNATDALTQHTDMAGFQGAVESTVGVHTGGHIFIGAEPGQNLFQSPGDPHFWLQHAYIDRIWWIWQNQQPQARRYMVTGTRTFQNDPPSSSTTLEDLMDLGVNAGARTLASVTSTLEDGLCYVYG